MILFVDCKIRFIKLAEVPGVARGILKHLRKKLILFSPCYLQGIPMGSLKKNSANLVHPLHGQIIYIIYMSEEQY